LGTEKLTCSNQKSKQNYQKRAFYLPKAIADGLKLRRIDVTIAPEVSHHLILRLAITESVAKQIAKSRQNLIALTSNQTKKRSPS
jgi:hypothetical protein